MRAEVVDKQEPMARGAAVIDCEGLVVERGHFQLGPIDLTVDTGTTIFLGRNGAGKTTMLRSFLGLEAASRGRVCISGVDVADRGSRRELMRRVGYAPQAALLPSTARVSDVVGYSAWLKGVPRAQTAERVDRALGLLDVASLAPRRVGQLSGGERQRVSIAVALVHGPSVLMLDEPSAGLDPVQRVSLRRALDRVAQERAVVLSTHLIEEVRGDRDSLIVLRDGTVGFQGTAAELIARTAPDASGDVSLEQAIWTFLGGDELA